MQQVFDYAPLANRVNVIEYVPLYPFCPPYHFLMPCFLANFSALLMSRAATAYTSTSGWLFAGVIRAPGAILAAPKMPNLSGALLLGALEGVGGVKNAFSSQPCKKVFPRDLQRCSA